MSILDTRGRWWVLYRCQTGLWTLVNLDTGEHEGVFDNPALAAAERDRRWDQDLRERRQNNGDL